MLTIPYPIRMPFIFKQIRGDGGEKGDKGDRGKRGRNGKRGKQGEPGKSIIGPRGERGPSGTVDKDFSQYMIKILEVEDKQIDYTWARLMCTDPTKDVDSITLKILTVEGEDQDEVLFLGLNIRKQIETTFIVVEPKKGPFIEICSGCEKNEFEIKLPEITKKFKIYLTVRWT